ncbi:DegQ family serine endoprotease [Wenzhouxiangella marina]|uniref:Probable periplasmic serine endoprotease DegP-like n=1 Tax=Wenzhouxiangella marina TaxID=1579979 RepID=A0A0K0XXT2_9GAMM|nr:DegQ family serine endoprotease [Wenzhouxiangella marina]AKS42442.1 Protease Do [Wenzhouxiangella marina]MBB6085783.1 serine protease Do [Wenzhouxiangella marina]
MVRCMIAFCLATLVAAPGAQAVTPVDFTDLVAESIPAVVNVETVRFGSRPSEQPEDTQQRGQMPDGLPDLFEEFFRGPRGGAQPDRRGGGSGFIMSSDGLVVTNHHVIDGADEIRVRLADRREYLAELVGSDAETDIAVLRIDAEEELPTLEFGDSSTLRAGEWVIAIGSPFQYEQSVTAGIVSAKGRSQFNQQYVPFIQSDVAINRGNSGGPLIRTDGTVVGINSWILSSNGGNIGLSFSIPIEVASSSIEQLLEFGRVSRGFLGVTFEGISRQKADALGLERPAGALVNRIEPDSPADRAGLQVGDVILRFNGQTVDIHTDLPPLVGMVRPGTEVEVDIFRWGEEMTLEVVLDERNEDQVAATGGRPELAEPTNALGLSVEALDDETRRRIGNPEGGVLIARVESDNAYRAGIRPGQAILMINNQPVNSLSDFQDIIEDLPSGRSVALLLQLPNGNTTFVAYLPEQDD